MVPFVDGVASTPAEQAALFSLVGAIASGVILKIVETLSQTKLRSLDDATNIRKELREEVKDLKEEGEEKDTEIEAWKTKYYDLRDQFKDLQVKYETLTAKCEAVMEETRRRKESK